MSKRHRIGFAMLMLSASFMLSSLAKDLTDTPNILLVIYFGMAIVGYFFAVSGGE